MLLMFYRSFQKIAIYSKSKLADVRVWIEEVYKYNGALELLEEFRKWDPPKFPVSGHVLVEYKVPGKLFFIVFVNFNLPLFPLHRLALVCMLNIGLLSFM